MIVFDSELSNKIYSNSKFSELEGFISIDEAKVSLAEFLYNNLGLTVELLFNLKIYPFQEIILRSWFDHNFCMSVWARGASKCADINTLCLTDRGFQKIIDIEVGQFVLANKEKQKILAKTINTTEDGLRLLTNKGFNITGKTDHRVLIFRPDIFTFEYKFLKDINPSLDLIPIKPTSELGGNFNIVSSFDNSQAHVREKDIFLKDEYDLFYLLGLILGDGCIRRNIDVQQNLCSITSEDEEILTFVQKKFKEYLPSTAIRVSQKKNNKAKEIRIYHAGFVRFLKHVGFSTAHYAHEKQFPDKIFLCSSDKIGRFIQGLFDTDGYISVRENPAKNVTRAKIGFTSASESLIDILQLVLLNFGIVSSKCLIHKRGKYFVNGQECETHDAWTVSLSNFYSLTLFRDNIGFGLSRKARQLDYRLSRQFRPTDYNSNLIPVGQYFINKYKKCHFKKVGFHIHKNLSSERLRFLLNKELIDEYDKGIIKFILDSNFVFDSVRSIETVKTQTVDIQVDKEVCYWGNGFINHNSWLCAVFCCLYPIFFPRTRIVLASNAFRSTRRLIQQIERFINAKGADLLRECYIERKGKLEFVRRADEMTLDINEGQIIAIPLNEKVRGTRGDILVVDEFLMVPEDIYKSVLMPFLTARNDIQEQLETEELAQSFNIPDDISEEDRALLTSSKKIIGLTSASYDFEFIYRLYMNWIDKINKPIGRNSYFVSRIGYQALPETLLDKEITEEAKSGGDHTAAFQREFMAIFSSSSDGYFNIRKLHEFTVKDGDLPCVQLKGSPDAKYVLAIDPSLSDSGSSDYFAMGVYLLNQDHRSITQVHTYARTGTEANLKDHIEYLYYLISCFNIVMIIGDFGGGNFNFIQACNQSAYFIDRGVKLDFIEGDFDSEDYLEQLKIARNSYNLTIRKICYIQKFQHTEWIRKSNEHLKTQIEAGKVYFASRLAGHAHMFKKATETEVPIIFNGKDDFERNILDFIAEQDNLIEQTKRQLALIEPTVTLQGTMRFDLPQHLRRSKSPGRSRKDNFTCIVMGCWIARVYYDMNSQIDEPVYNTFDPILI